MSTLTYRRKWSQARYSPYPMGLVHNPADLEHLLLYICREASVLRRELEAVANELRAEERTRFEGTLNDIELRSHALLFAMPEPGTVH
jgi:hypothetical protein